jgi:poly-gamma-glutamate system protein
MRRRHGKISIFTLIIVTLITVILIVLELNSKSKVTAPHYKEKLAAAQLTQQACAVIKDAVNNLNIPIDRINDPNETGLIGLQYSPITTERGDLTAKLTSTNPNWAALIVSLLTEAGIESGDVIAISLSGSFPALNVAVMSALKTVDLVPIIITSVGSSMWGANYPELTYLDMEHILNQHDLFSHTTMAASIGGEDDIGRGLSPEGRAIIMEAMERNGVRYLNAQNVEEAITRRIDLFNEHGPVRLFINVGEQITALASMDIGSGLMRPRQIKGGAGLIAHFSSAGIPVINLVDVNDLAKRYDLPIAPIPLPRAGTGSLYYEFQYSVTQAIVSTIILLVILFFVLRFDIDYYITNVFKRRTHD